MFHRTPMLIVLCLLSGFTSPARAEDSKDVKEVREAVKAFVAALGKGDAVEARRHATSDELTSGMIDVVIPMIKAATKIHDAAVRQFGEQAGSFGQQMNPANALAQFGKIADSADVQIEGPNAILTPPQPPPQTQPSDDRPRRRFDQNPANRGLTLRRESYAWRVDLSAMPQANQIRQMTPMLRAMTDAMNDLADEIRAGEFQDTQEVQQALRQKIMESIIRGRGQ